MLNRADGSNRTGTGEEGKSCRRHTRARIEVFSAVMTFRGCDILDCRPVFFGVIFLHSCNHDFIIFDAEALDPLQINSEGHLTLTSLRHSIPVEDEIVIFLWLIEPDLCTMDVDKEKLWEAKSNDMNQFICRTIQCPYSNYLDVSFAVYHDAVEAHLDIYFVHFENIIEQDALIKVHGTVSASNSSLSVSDHPNAKSFLFHKLSEECVSLKPGVLVPLPLSRRITAVPRQSTLLVHVSIDVGNVLVIDETVKFNFNPSLDSAEGFIILPNHGKVLVKVSWVDCQTLDADGNNHLSIEEDVAPQEANFMGALAGEEDLRPQECFRDFNVPRSEYQTGVHTRSFSHSLSPPQQTDVHTGSFSCSLSPPQQIDMNKQQLPVSMYNFRSLMEVFSVKFLEFDQLDLHEMYGCILLRVCPTYVIFSRKKGGPLNITPQGFVKLRGPNTAIEPFDPVLVFPHLFRYETWRDQFIDPFEKLTWDNEAMWDDTRGGRYDTFLSKRVQSQFGLIEVNYAVYLYSVEARVGVTLTGCQFSSAVVYGCITAQNSKFGEKEARSFLFNRDKTEGIRIDVSPDEGKVAKLPLSRSITVHPIGSVVTITVNIWQSGQDQPIAKNEIFLFRSLSGRQVVKTLWRDACQVIVDVTMD